MVRGLAEHRAQRGAALLLMLAVIILGLSWIFVTRLAAANFIARERSHNAKILNQAKQALIGWVAMKAAEAGEDNPGRLPCPEAAGYYGDPAQEGIAAGSCALPKVGRLPWRTLGLDKLVDAAGEPLWYAVSPGWAYNGADLVINSNSPAGQLGVDGSANDSVALIIAPGAAFTVPAAAGCGAWNQTRAISGTPDARNYLECENATWPPDTNFVSTGPSASFNDQVLKVTVADLLPAIEAAIAHRTEREIAPLLKNVYAGSVWGLSSTNPVFPYAAPFADPASSSFQGMPVTYQGLLPFTANAGCTPVTDPRCATGFVTWNTVVMPSVAQTGGAGVLGPYLCTITATQAQCSGTYVGAIQVRMTATAEKVAMALRQINSSATTVEYGLLSLGLPSAGTASGAFNNDGSAQMYTDASLPLLDPVLAVQFRITANIGVLADHTLLDPNNAITGWFSRNEWYRLAYYAIAPNHAASGVAPRSCSDSPLTCLSIVNLAPAGKQRAILILAGRSLPGKTRPSPSLDDYLEFGNATGAFERQPVSTALVAALKKPFNDRVVVIDANP